MFEVLASYLKINASLTDAEIARIHSRTTPKRIRKRQYLLQEGDVSRYNSFVTKGCLRLYHVGNNGDEHILRFATEEWWISDYESYNTGKPSKNNIDALEDSELILLEKSAFEELQNEIPKLKLFKEKLDTRSFNASQNRILSNISDTAEQRYENFIRLYPHFFKRVPLHMVASYLGLTRETLSRIRSQSAKKY